MNQLQQNNIQRSNKQASNTLGTFESLTSEAILNQIKDLLANTGVSVTELFKFYDIRNLVVKVVTHNIPYDLKKRSIEMIIRLYYTAKQGAYSTEFEVVYRYIDWISKIPWNVFTKDNIDPKNIVNELNKTHYGLQKVKTKIATYIAALKMRLDKSGSNQQVLSNIPVLLFVGLQGLGKTTIAKSIANALGRKFVKFSFAAFGDILQLRGKPKSYPDAEPGLVIKALIQAGSMNPVLLMDELDKASANEALRADIYAALLEIFDPSQNTHFVDKYIDYPIDLSKVFFIATANTTGTLPAALLDRVELVHFTSYTDEEKIVIGKNYILPKVLKEVGLSSDQLRITDAAWPLIVRPMGFDAGIRQLSRILMNLGRKVAYEILTGKVNSVTITPENLKQYLDVETGYIN